MHQYDEAAMKLGATHYAYEYYPEPQYLCRHPELPQVFAVRYFNAEKREVGYVLPCLPDNFHTFETPRVWWEGYLNRLSFKTLLGPEEKWKR